MQTRADLLTLCAVMVGITRPGRAYAHDPNGQCVSFTGTRGQMLDLFREHRAFLRGVAPAVAVRPEDWLDLHAIARSECPNHMLPAITGEISPYTPY